MSNKFVQEKALKNGVSFNLKPVTILIQHYSSRQYRNVFHQKEYYTSLERSRFDILNHNK